VHEHMPRLAQHDRLLAVHAVGISDCDRSVDCTHDPIVDPTFRIPSLPPAVAALGWASVRECPSLEGFVAADLSRQ